MSDWLKVLAKSGLEVQPASFALRPRGFLSTGNYALDWAVSGRLVGGGFPLGCTAVIFGDPSTGKSTLLARVIAMAQAAGGVGLLDDVESGYDLSWMARLGVDTDDLAYRRSRTVKEHLDTATAFVKAYRGMEAGPGVLALDSIGQLSTEHELETRLDKRDMTKAAELKAFFRVITPEIADLPVLHLSANHTIANIGNLFQSRTTPGGGGPKFAATVMVDLRATSKIKTKTEHTGVICRAVVVKNRITPPWKEVRLAIPFNATPSRASGLIPLLVKLGVLYEKGQFLFKDGQRLGRAYKSKGKFLRQDAAAEQILDDHPTLLAETDAMLAAASVESETGEEEEDEEEEAK